MEGNVAANSISVVNVLPEGLTLSDSDWTQESDGSATIALPGTLEPDESMTVDITTTVVGSELDNLVAINSATPLDANGDVLVNVLGITISDADADPSSDDPADADDFVLTLMDPATEPRLAFTGLDVAVVALLALLLLAFGATMLFIEHRLAGASRD